MKTHKYIFCGVTVILLSVLSISAQPIKRDAKNVRITINMEKEPLGTVFQYLMEKYDVAIGFEQSILDRNHSEYRFNTNLATPSHTVSNGKITLTTTTRNSFEASLHPISLAFNDASLSDVFDAIVKQMDNYEWKIDDGVVNIYPVEGRDERFEKLLNLKISKFTVKEGGTVEDITLSIVQLPEFRAFIKDTELYFMYVRVGMDFEIKARYGRSLDKGIDLSNVTFREVLNKSTKIKRGGWILRWKGVAKQSGRELIDIDI